MASIGFIGAGNMATAIIKGIIGKNVFNFSDVWVSDVDFTKLRGLKNEIGLNISSDNRELAEKVDILVLSVKPQAMTKVLEGLKGAVKENTVVVSIAAGIRICKIADALGDLPIVRVMPNTPALVGQGAAGIYGNEKALPSLDKVKKIFTAVGLAVVVDNESLIDAVTAISGSGPAYFFLMMEKMIEAAEELGIEQELAKKLVLQTAKGAAELAIDSSDSPAVLRQKVTSPGGTTEAALKVFSQGGMESTIVAGIRRACLRSVELSE